MRAKWLCPALLFVAACASSGAPSADPLAPSPGVAPAQMIVVERGDLAVTFHDNTGSPKQVLSGVDRLFNVREAPGFDAFDPDSPGAGAGLNFEHIISGHPGPNAFTPRNGPFALYPLPGGRAVRLVRRWEDDPWAVASTMTYTVVEPHFIDFDFRCTAHDAKKFGARGHAIFFWADYMNDVEDVPIHFRGVEREGGEETWIAGDAPPGPPDWNTGGTYRSRPAEPIDYDADHNFKLNSWSYDWPRIAQPFYYGRAGRGMALILMFDRLHAAEDEIRFSLFKFKLKKEKQPRPAWDFQYVIHKVEEGKTYGFRGRLVWKKFVSPEDCRGEYEAWSNSQFPNHQ